MLQVIARLLGWAPPPAVTGGTSLASLAAAPPPGLAVARSTDLCMPVPLLDPALLRARNRARALDIAKRQSLSRNAEEGLS
jgi:hypothetical protein